MTDPRATRPEPGESVLAGLWSFTLQRIAALAAHEINNALNGAVMNVEVVRARARPGGDAGTLAPFAEAAAGQLEELAAMSEALLALARPPRGTVDAGAVVRHVAALLGPAVARHGVRIDTSGARACPAGGDPAAARLAVAAALLAVVERAADPEITAEIAGTKAATSAVEPARHVRCTTRVDDRSLVVLTPRHGASLPPAVERALRSADIDISSDADALTLALPASAVP